jgi:hypothetical protein
MAEVSKGGIDVNLEADEVREEDLNSGIDLNWEQVSVSQ